MGCSSSFAKLRSILAGLGERDLPDFPDFPDPEDVDDRNPLFLGGEGRGDGLTSFVGGATTALSSKTCNRTCSRMISESYGK